MFTLCNLRKESKEGWVYLICDLQVTEIENPFKEKTIWVAVEEENEDMLSTKVYDPFVLIPVFLGMYYGQDVHVAGNMSARLYHNITHYLMSIFGNFHSKTKQIRFTADGFDTVEECEVSLVGTSISCGVDSLTTIYDNYVMEEDPNFRINSLFFANCCSHGKYNKASRELWLDRAALNRKAADELNLPMYLIDSNFAAYVWVFRIDQVIGYMATYSCILALQKYVRRYLMAGNLQYDEIAEFKDLSKDFDISEYCESYMPHLVSTEKFELVTDGCQYTRGEKTERISDWDIAQKYLNVCVRPINHGKNCSNCNKCMWTLIPLEAMGKLQNFQGVFDVAIYKKNARKWKTAFAAHEGRDAMETSVVRYCRNRGMDFPRLDEATEILSLKEEVTRMRREINRLKYQGRNIVIYGAGENLKENLNVIDDSANICAIVDRDERKWGIKYGSYVCTSPEHMMKIDNPVVVVTIVNAKLYRAIREQLEEMGIKDIIRISEWFELQ